MPDVLPLLELIIVAGIPTWSASGCGIVVRHQQRWQAEISWWCQVKASGSPKPQAYHPTDAEGGL